MKPLCLTRPVKNASFVFCLGNARCLELLEDQWRSSIREQFPEIELKIVNLRHKEKNNFVLAFCRDS